MARKAPTITRPQLLSFASVVIFYGVLLTFAWVPSWYLDRLGQSAWHFQVIWLSLNALASLGLFFWSSMSSPHSWHWQRTTLINAALLSVPLYFLWLRFAY